jgi:hypothetical protein
VQRLLELLAATSKDRFATARAPDLEPHARVTINQQRFSFGAVNLLCRERMC